MSPDLVLIWTFVFGLPAAGLVCGLLRERAPRAWLYAAAGVAAIYALVLTSTGIWAASCWDCDAGAPLERKHYVWLALTWGGVFVFLVEISIWAGTRISKTLWRHDPSP